LALEHIERLSGQSTQRVTGNDPVTTEPHDPRGIVEDWLYVDDRGLAIPDSEWGRELFAALSQLMSTLRSVETLADRWTRIGTGVAHPTRCGVFGCLTCAVLGCAEDLRDALAPAVHQGAREPE
jgi:hypothetical protein